MSQLVPVIERPMPVVAEDDKAGFGERLHELLTHDVAAFIVRSQVLEGAYERHRDMLLAGLAALHPDIPAEIHPFAVQNPNQAPIGTLHHDMDYVIDHEMFPGTNAILHRWPLTFPALHTTTSGGGAVRIAHVGPNLEAVLAYSSNTAAPLASTDPANPHNMLLSGFVDPTVINPEVFAGRVVAGCSVVHAGDSGQFAVWHRFDTDPSLGHRTAEGGFVAPANGVDMGYDIFIL